MLGDGFPDCRSTAADTTRRPRSLCRRPSPQRGGCAWCHDSVGEVEDVGVVPVDNVCLELIALHVLGQYCGRVVMLGEGKQDVEREVEGVRSGPDALDRHTE